jgi:hypothetical protein
VCDATGDEFFLPDDDALWWGKLPGDTYRLMVANTDHGFATGLPTLMPSFAGFVEGVLASASPPVFSWTIDAVTGDITVVSKTAPSSVRMVALGVVNSGEKRGGGCNGRASCSLPACASSTQVTMWYANTNSGLRRDFRQYVARTPLDNCTFHNQAPTKDAEVCWNVCLWVSETVGPSSVQDGVYTYILTQPLPAVGWRGAWQC